MVAKKNSLEGQLNEPQEIVNKLESGNVLLGDVLNELQAGVKLSYELEKKLNDAEQTVIKLVDKDGNERASDPQSAPAPRER